MRRHVFLVCLTTMLLPQLLLAATRGSMLNCAAYMSLARQAPDTPYVLEQLGHFSNDISTDLTKPKFFGHLTVTHQSRLGKQQKVAQQIRGIRHMQFRQGESTPIKTVAFAVQGKAAIQRFIEQVRAQSQFIDDAIMAHPQHRYYVAKNKLATVFIPPGALVFAALGFLFHESSLWATGITLLLVHNPISMILYLLPDRARSNKWTKMLTRLSHFPDTTSDTNIAPNTWSYWTQSYRLENQAINSIWNPERPSNYGALRNQDYLDHRGTHWRWFKHHLLPRLNFWPQKQINAMHQEESKGWVVTDELLWFNPTIGQPELLVVVRASDQPLKKAMPVRVKAKAPAPALAPQPVPVPNP